MIWNVLYWQLVNRANLVTCIENRPRYLAEQLEKSMAGLGTNDKVLIRLILQSREPSLLKSVKQEYLMLYKKSLSKRVDGETSGNYRLLAAAIIGN